MKPHLLVLSAVLVASSWSIAAFAAETSLPAPIDLAAAPVPDSPGGARLPVLEAKATVDAPVIAAGTETAFADETLCLTGSNLDGVALRLWSENSLTDLPPLRSAPDRLQAVLLKSFPASTLLLWPPKDGKTGAPFRVNEAAFWWAWPHRVQPGKDGTVRLFGRNLTLPGREPQCVVEAGGKKQRLKVLRHDAYHLEAALPDDLAEDSITLWAHNGTGGAFGWSDPLSLAVTRPARAPERKFRVDDFGPPPTAAYPDHAYGLGNVFRSNTGLGAGAAGVVGYSFPDDRRYPSAYRPGLYSGLIMSVVENNQWRDVERGFVLSEPVNWLVFRNNLIETKDPAAPAIERIRETGMVAPLIE